MIKRKKDGDDQRVIILELGDPEAPYYQRCETVINLGIISHTEVCVDHPTNSDDDMIRESLVLLGWLLHDRVLGLFLTDDTMVTEVVADDVRQATHDPLHDRLIKRVPQWSWLTRTWPGPGQKEKY